MTLHEAFVFYAPTGAPDECWPWPLSCSNKGYGQLAYGGRPHLAHRISWEVANGQPAPPAEKVRHTCDNPPCVNPAHLILGSSADNSRDMVERRRSSFGERNGRSKLTEPQVLEARQLRLEGMQYKDIAMRYGVGTPAIWMAINTHWQYLTETDPPQDLDMVEASGQGQRSQ